MHPQIKQNLDKITQISEYVYINFQLMNARAQKLNKQQSTKILTNNTESMQMDKSASTSQQSNIIQINVLLIGKIGAGKTRFTNNICGQNFKHEICCISCTKTTNVGVYKSESGTAQQQYVMRIFDTPGIDSTQSNSKQSLQQTLQKHSYNLIVVMAKLGNRYSYDTMPDITKISNMLRKYRERVIYVVTSLDIVENLEVGGKERVVRDFMEQFKKKEKVAMVSNRQECEKIGSQESECRKGFDKLREIIYKEGAQFSQIKIQIDINQIQKTFKKRKFQIISSRQSIRSGTQKPKIKIYPPPNVIPPNNNNKGKVGRIIGSLINLLKQLARYIKQKSIDICWKLVQILSILLDKLMSIFVYQQHKQYEVQKNAAEKQIKSQNTVIQENKLNLMKFQQSKQLSISSSQYQMPKPRQKQNKCFRKSKQRQSNFSKDNDLDSTLEQQQILGI